jgi:hypothetical protein
MDDKGHAGLYNLAAHYEQTVNRGPIEIVFPMGEYGRLLQFAALAGATGLRRWCGDRCDDATDLIRARR